MCPPQTVQIPPLNYPQYRSDYPITMNDFEMESGLNYSLLNDDPLILARVGFGEEEKETALKRYAEARNRC
jgi:hypothetical protein